MISFFGINHLFIFFMGSSTIGDDMLLFSLALWGPKPLCEPDYEGPRNSSDDNYWKTQTEYFTLFRSCQKEKYLSLSPQNRRNTLALLHDFILFGIKITPPVRPTVLSTSLNTP